MKFQPIDRQNLFHSAILDSDAYSPGNTWLLRIYLYNAVYFINDAFGA